MKANKYIFVDKQNNEQEFRCGYVELHEDLLNKHERGSHTHVNGGGFFTIDTNAKSIVFWGSSGDFGHVKGQNALCEKYYHQIIKKLEDTWYYTTFSELDMSDFSLYLQNEMGEKTLVTPK